MPKFSEIPKFILLDFFSMFMSSPFYDDSVTFLRGPRATVTGSPFADFYGIIELADSTDNVTFYEVKFKPKGYSQEEYYDGGNLFFLERTGTENIDITEECNFYILRKKGGNTQTYFYSIIENGIDFNNIDVDYFVNPSKHRQYLGKLYPKDNYYVLDYHGIDRYATSCLPEHNQTEKLKEFFYIFFDQVYNAVYSRQRNLNTLLDAKDVPLDFLPEIPKFFNLEVNKDFYESLFDDTLSTATKIKDRRTRDFVFNLINLLKRSGTYSSLYAIYKALFNPTDNNLAVYERWHLPEVMNYTGSFDLEPHLIDINYEEYYNTTITGCASAGNYYKTLDYSGILIPATGSYIHAQTSAAARWFVFHSLECNVPIVQILDSTLTKIIPSGVNTITPNLTIIDFASAIKGFALITKPEVISTFAGSRATWNFMHNLDTIVPIAQNLYPTTYVYDTTTFSSSANVILDVIAPSGTNRLLEENSPNITDLIAVAIEGDYIYSTDTPSASWTIEHDLDSKAILLDCYAAIPSSAWYITHNFDTRDLIIAPYNSDHELVTHTSIYFQDTDLIKVYFSDVETGFIRLITDAEAYALTSNTTWAASHAQNSKYPIVQVRHTSNYYIAPTNITAMPFSTSTINLSARALMSGAALIAEPDYVHTQTVKHNYWNIKHNLDSSNLIVTTYVAIETHDITIGNPFNSKNIIVQCYNDDRIKVYPSTARISSSSIRLEFSTEFKGFIVLESADDTISASVSAYYQINHDILPALDYNIITQVHQTVGTSGIYLPEYDNDEIIQLDSDESIFYSQNRHWIFYDNALDITTYFSYSGAWEEVSLEGAVSNDATAVLLLVRNINLTSRYASFRPVGNTQISQQYLQGYAYYGPIKLTADKKIDAWLNSFYVKVYVVGYYEGNTDYFFEDFINISTTTTGSWDSIGLNAPATSASGVWLTSVQDSAARSFDIRSEDCTTDFSSRTMGGSGPTLAYAVSQVSDAGNIEQYIESANQDVYLTGYIPQHDAAWFDNYLTCTIGATGTWTTITIEDQPNATMAMVRLINEHASENYRAAVRKKSSSDSYITETDFVKADGQLFAFVGLNENAQFEVWTDNLSVKAYVVGVSLGNIPEDSSKAFQVIRGHFVDNNTELNNSWYVEHHLDSYDLLTSFYTPLFTDIAWIEHNYGFAVAQIYNYWGIQQRPDTLIQRNNHEIQVQLDTSSTSGYYIYPVEARSFTHTTSAGWTIYHNLNSRNLIAQVYDSTTGMLVHPLNLALLDNNTANVTLSAATSGQFVVALAEYSEIATVAANPYTVEHNLGAPGIIVSVFSSIYEEYIPTNVTIVDENTCTVSLSGTPLANVRINVAGAYPVVYEDIPAEVFLYNKNWLKLTFDKNTIGYTVLKRTDESYAPCKLVQPSTVSFVSNDELRIDFDEETTGYASIAIADYYAMQVQKEEPDSINLDSENIATAEWSSEKLGYAVVKEIGQIPYGANLVSSPHYKVEIDINCETLCGDDILTEDYAEFLMAYWKLVKPVSKYAHYSILIAPSATFTSSTTRLYNNPSTSADIYTYCCREAGSVATGYVYSQVLLDDIWNITHGLNTENVIVQCYDDTFNLVYPSSVQIVDSNNITVKFYTPFRGVCLILTAEDNITNTLEASGVWEYDAHMTGISDSYFYFDKKQILPSNMQIIPVDDIKETWYVPTLGYCRIRNEDYLHAQLAQSTTWTITHTLDYYGVIVKVYDGNLNEIMPSNIQLDSNSPTVTVDFGTTPVSGYAYISSVGNLYTQASIIDSIKAGGYIKVGQGTNTDSYDPLITNDLKDALDTDYQYHVIVTEDDYCYYVKGNFIGNRESSNITEIGLFNVNDDIMFYSYVKDGNFYKAEEFDYTVFYGLIK